MSSVEAEVEQANPLPLPVLIQLRPCGPAHCTYRALVTLMITSKVVCRILLPSEHSVSVSYIES